MPYKTVADLPADQVRGLSDKQKRAFLHAFNSAVYEQRLPEENAFKIAHTAARKAGTKKKFGFRKKA